ncbi:hypothetical protein ACF0H5_012447 [Mactra antiquata]
MDYHKIMKAVETISIFVCVFLITWSTGDTAPQWRPQGRFGKRFSNTRTTNDLMSALQTVAQDDEELGQLLLNDPDFRMVNTDAVEELFSNPTSDLTSSSSANTDWSIKNHRLCIETNFPGVFRCHRKGLSDVTILALHEE